jgi:hypothetical protein
MVSPRENPVVMVVTNILFDHARLRVRSANLAQRFPVPRVRNLLSEPDQRAVVL